MSLKNKKATLSHLKIIMMHIVKWYSEPLMRSISWIRSINNGRDAIKELQEKNPSITDDFIKQNWDGTLKKAIKDAEKEMEVPATKTSLTFDEVFKHPYTLTLLFIIALSFIFW